MVFKAGRKDDLHSFLDSEASLSSSVRYSGRRPLRPGLSKAMVRLAVGSVAICAALVLWAFTGIALKTSRRAEEWSSLGLGKDPFEEVTVVAPDGSLKATFIPIGATLTNLWIKDRDGNFRDVVLGYDDKRRYLTDAAHPYFGAVVGRYANRIKNGTFTLPPTPSSSIASRTYHLPLNEHGGQNTLHGGKVGYDRRTFVLLSKTKTTVEFALVDQNGTEGFPGTVTLRVKYSLLSGGKWRTSMHAESNEATPLMLSSHVYWNLDAYQGVGDGESSALDHWLQVKASQVIETDGILVPTGGFRNVEGTAFDFRTPQKLGSRLSQTQDFCGSNCVGYDNAWIYDKGGRKDVMLSMWSEKSGIRLDVTTNQAATQVYTCNGIHTPELPRPPISRKASHGSGFYTKHSCVVLEQEGLLDGINHPEWGKASGNDQVVAPKRPYVWTAEYTFSTVR